MQDLNFKIFIENKFALGIHDIVSKLKQNKEDPYSVLNAYARGSTYWRKKDSEKAEIFHKIEPYLTFLNIHQLERQGADNQSKVEELEDLNQSLRQRDKVKDDAIAQLSDQLVSLSARLQEIERRQMC
jgi:hypothetical protein